jgi:hypothetical protein
VQRGQGAGCFFAQGQGQNRPPYHSDSARLV